MTRRSSSDGFLFKTGLFAALAGLAFWIFNHHAGNKTGTEPAAVDPVPTTETPKGEPEPPVVSTVPENIFPGPSGGELVKHGWFALSYVEAHEQAEWVAYEITRDHLNQNWAERPQTFRPDPDVRTESATPRDYTGSGYDKGHLCAAADMAFNATAIDETFLMSNMSPQVPAFNKGIWRELEECTRDWARRYKLLYVVTGPVLKTQGMGQIGFSKVTVPAAYYKALLAPDARRAVAFIIPNAKSDRPVMDFVCTIDQAEKITGLDFYPQILKGSDEELEAALDKSAWPVNQQRYEKRVREWQ